MDLDNKKINIEISASTIIKFLIILLVVLIFYLIRDIIIILFFAFILVSILEPIVDWLKSKKIPKLLAVIFIYLLLLASVVLIVILLIPPMSAQFNQLINTFPVYSSKINTGYAQLNNFFNQYGLSQKIEQSLETIRLQLPQLNIFDKVTDFFTGLISIIIILIITFYLLVEENAVKKILRSLMPVDFLPYAYQLFSRIQKKLGQWLSGQIILGLIIFVLVYLVLLISGVRYALILAIIAGMLEFLPYLGPLISGAIAVFLTIFQSPIMAFWVLLIYIVIQFMENHILVPLIMRKTVGLNPVLSICALLVGAKLGGIIGVILAIPAVAVLSVFLQDFLDKKKEADYKLED
jgi:predicted PurR-regulated permease PerM